MIDIILASSSPRRVEMMNDMKIPYRIEASYVDEAIDHTLKPYEIVMELSKRKALSVFVKNKDSLVLGFDTIVSVDDMILEKPKDEEDCIRMIKLLRNRWHDVYTGSYIVSKDYIESFYTKTSVFIGDISDKDLIDYSKTKEPYDKAGAYAIQGTIGKYITDFDGDRYNVMGMPKDKVYKILMDYVKNK